MQHSRCRALLYLTLAANPCGWCCPCLHLTEMPRPKELLDLPEEPASKWDWNPTGRLQEWNVPSAGSACQPTETGQVAPCTGGDLSAAGGPPAHGARIPTCGLSSGREGDSKCPQEASVSPHLLTFTETDLFRGQKPTASSRHRIPRLLCKEN